MRKYIMCVLVYSGQVDGAGQDLRMLVHMRRRKARDAISENRSSRKHGSVLSDVTPDYTL